MSRVFGDRRSSQARATDIGATFSRAATLESALDGEVVDQFVVVAVRQVVHVLPAHLVTQIAWPAHSPSLALPSLIRPATRL